MHRESPSNNGAGAFFRRLYCIARILTQVVHQLLLSKNYENEVRHDWAERAPSPRTAVAHLAGTKIPLKPAWSQVDQGQQLRPVEEGHAGGSPGVQSRDRYSAKPSFRSLGARRQQATVFL
jgi:hypothetical protein